MGPRLLCLNWIWSKQWSHPALGQLESGMMDPSPISNSTSFHDPRRFLVLRVVLMRLQVGRDDDFLMTMALSIGSLWKKSALWEFGVNVFHGVMVYEDSLSMFHLSLGNNASPTLLDSLSKFGRHQIWLQMFELRCSPCFASWNCQQMINVVRRKPLGFARFAIFCYRHERCHPLSSVPIDMNSDMRWKSLIFFSIFGLVILISCNMKKWLHPWLIRIVSLWRFLIPRTKSVAMFWLKWALVSSTRMLCFFFRLKLFVAERKQVGNFIAFGEGLAGFWHLSNSSEILYHLTQS